MDVCTVIADAAKLLPVIYVSWSILNNSSTYNSKVQQKQQQRLEREHQMPQSGNVSQSVKPVITLCEASLIRAGFATEIAVAPLPEIEIYM